MTREEAKQKFLTLYCKNRAFCELYYEHCKEDKCEIYHAIKALEAEPIKRGHWIWTGKDRPGAPESIRCSECGFWYIRLTPRFYCSNCGAKMDEESDIDENWYSDEYRTVGENEVDEQ